MSENDLQLPITFDVDQKIELAVEMNDSNLVDCSKASGEVVSLSDYISEKKSVAEAEEKEKIYQGILDRVKHLV